MSTPDTASWGKVLRVPDGHDFTPLCESSFNAVEQAIEVARMLPVEHPTRLDLLQSCAEALKFRMMFAGCTSGPAVPAANPAREPADSSNPEPTSGLREDLLAPLTLGVLWDQLVAIGTSRDDARVFLQLGNSVQAISCGSFGRIAGGVLTLNLMPLIERMEASDSSPTDHSPSSSS